jgi:hypothetical protein
MMLYALPRGRHILAYVFYIRKGIYADIDCLHFSFPMLMWQCTTRAVRACTSLR